MYKNCKILQHGLCFFDNKLASCCYSPVDQVDGQCPPVLYDNYKGEIIPPDELFKKIEEYSGIFKKGGCPRECKDCYHIKEADWSDEKYIDYITITHFSACNADCIYCTSNNEVFEKTNKVYPILPILKYFKEQGVIKQGCELHIGGGEFTIYKECDELLELFAVNNYARVFVPTNAVKYSDTLFRAMDEASTYIIVSLDCGCRKTFKTIKRVDAFDKVMDSLTKYAKTEKSKEAIRLKYIIIPTYNDNIGEFKKFLKIAKKLGVKNLIIDIDARYCRETKWQIDSYYINLAQKMNEIAKKQGFISEFYSFYFQSTNNKDTKKDNIFNQIYKYIKFKYFNNKIKELYRHHLYGAKKEQFVKKKKL